MRPVRVLVGALLASLLLAAPAVAGKPIMERVSVADVDVVDEDLTEACGFEVRLDASGHIIFRVWLDDEGNPIREVNNYAVRYAYRSAGASISVVDVGADRVTHFEDGSFTIAFIGNIQSIQIPGQGRVYSDVGRVELHVTFPEEGEPIVELLSEAGQHTTDFDICDVLAP